MTNKAIDFGRERSPIRAQGKTMAVALVVVAGILLARSRIQDSASVDPVVVVDVRGDVSKPGFHAVSPPGMLRAALVAAGADATGVEDRVVGAGMRVLVHGDEIDIGPMDDRLVFGLPVDLNTASQAALESIPGIGPQRARGIIAHREHHGRFPDVDALEHVHGFGAATVESVRPFVEVD